MNKSVEISEKLGKLIENPKSELNFSNTFELLVAVMLSAQCTDKRVNIVTQNLFQKYKSPSDFAIAKPEELEKDISSINYFHNKAKNLILASQMIMDKYSGIVPNSHEELVKLPGVGNKTANVILAVGFEIPALAVDTHVLRVSNRLGLAKTKNPIVCENELKKLFPINEWVDMHHKILLFGRYYCTARNPKCLNCVLKNICNYKE